MSHAHVATTLATLVAVALYCAPVEARQGQGTASRPVTKPVTRVFKDTDPVPAPVRLQTFRLVWETVRDKYFDPSLAGIDWNAVKTRYEPRLAEATTSQALHGLLDRMVHELPVSHIKVKLPGSTQTFPPGMMEPDAAVLRAGDEGVMVFAVPEGSPAWKAGLRPGYKVLGVGETTLPDAAVIRQSPFGPLTQATRLLAGPPSSAVRVRVLDGQNREQTITLQRTLPFRQVSHLGRAEVRSTRPAARVGYLWFDWWAIDLADKLEPVLARLGDTDGLVIDLRQNPGGTNPGVNRLAKFLLADPGVIAIHTGRATKPREWRHEGGGAAAYRGRVAILIDEGTGSASEVFTALLQERGRATVVGRTSYGGVLISMMLPLPTGGVLQYPHADVTTAKGQRLEGRGVVPDIAVALRRADLLAGKDTVLERAIEALSSARGSQVGRQAE